MQPVFHYPSETLIFEPTDICTRWAIGALFPGRESAPLEIDLGCGDGAFLLASAAEMPERNFIGVERLLGRVRRTCRGAAAAGLRNVRLVRLETLYLMRYLLPPGSVSVLHLMFPDPWPKRRHWHHRVFQASFLDAAHPLLTPDGEIRLTTDDEPYYRHMRSVFEGRADFREEPWEPGPDYPQTDFEKGFRAQGLPIYRALLRRVSGPGSVDSTR
jgi:tRNA (guanine-N7-)-methyltransferase